MDLFEKMEAALQAGDIDAVASFYHADFEMKMHSNGAVMTKEQWKAGAASIFSDSKFKRESARCIYENEDILVSHAIMTFPNGSKDAVMWVATKKKNKNAISFPLSSFDLWLYGVNRRVFHYSLAAFCAK